MRKRTPFLVLVLIVAPFFQRGQTALVFANATISSVSLTTGSDVITTSVDPEVTYKFKFNVFDPDSLDDLNNIVVKIYYEASTMDDIRSCYTFTWTEGAGSTPFVSSPLDYVVTSSVIPTAEEELLSSFDFELHFNLDGVAVPSGSSTTWNVDVTVTDDSAATDSNTETVFDVTKYQAFTVSTSSIAFGTAVPGATLTKQQVTVTLTTNTQVDINVQGGDLTYSSYSIPADQFNAWDDSAEFPTSYTLSTSDTTVYDDYVTVADAINSGVTGYTDAGDLLVGFDGTVPSVQAVGSYTATWRISIDQSGVNAN